MKKTAVLALTLLASAPSAADPAFALTGQARGLNRDATGALIGAGRDYAAAFETDGVRFQPALPGASRAAELAFQLESVAVGAQSIEVPGGVEPQSSGHVVRYDRGSFVEHYEVLGSGIEQSFVFDELPARGDLVVRGRLTTELALAFADPEHGLRFENETGGGVVVGGVTGIDAAGRSAAGWIRVDGDRLELGLGAEFVRSAELPLVLDPLIGAVVGLGVGATDDSAPDVSQFKDRNLVVWEYALGGGVTHIRAREYDLAGNPLTGIVTLSSAGTDTRPAVGVLADEKPKFVVAWQHADGLGDTTIRVTFFYYDFSGTVGIIELSSTGTDVDPDVGYDVAACPVVWAEKNGIRMAEVSDDGAGNPASGGVNVVSTNQADVTPAISQSAAGAEYPLVVWDRNVPGALSIHGRRWPRLASAGAWPAEFSVFTGGLSSSAPDVSSSSGEDYFATWELAEAGSPSSRDIKARRIFFPGAARRLGTIIDIEADPADDESAPAIAYATNQYLIAFLDASGPVNEVLVAQAIDPMTGAFLEGTMTVAGASPIQSPAVAAASQSSSDASDDYLIVWDEPSGGGDDDLMGRRAEGVGGSHQAVTGTGCGFFSGETRVSAPTGGNPAIRHELWYGEPGAPAYIMIGAPQINVPWGTGAIVPFPTVLQFIGIADLDGYTAFQSNVTPSLSGLTVWEQWLIFSAGGSCDPSGWSLADAVQITFE